MKLTQKIKAGFGYLPYASSFHNCMHIRKQRKDLSPPLLWNWQTVLNWRLFPQGLTPFRYTACHCVQKNLSWHVGLEQAYFTEADPGERVSRRAWKLQKCFCFSSIRQAPAKTNIESLTENCTLRVKKARCTQARNTSAFIAAFPVVMSVGEVSCLCRRTGRFGRDKEMHLPVNSPTASSKGANVSGFQPPFLLILSLACRITALAWIRKTHSAYSFYQFL